MTLATRVRYVPHFRWKPFSKIKCRRYSSSNYGEVTRYWTIYLFGLIPIARLPRSEDKPS